MHLFGDCSKDHWSGEWLDFDTNTPSIFRNLLRATQQKEWEPAILSLDMERKGSTPLIDILE